VLAKTQTQGPVRISVRYYLWSADGPWRIPDRLHRDLIDRKLALPQYATSKQKVLEVFARRIGADTYSLRGRGSIYAFDEKGYLERGRGEELMGFIVDRAQQELKSGNVVSRFINVTYTNSTALRTLALCTATSAFFIGAHQCSPAYPLGEPLAAVWLMCQQQAAYGRYFQSSRAVVLVALASALLFQRTR
jgi:hypothetical protein